MCQCIDRGLLFVVCLIPNDVTFGMFRLHCVDLLHLNSHADANFFTCTLNCLFQYRIVSNRNSSFLFNNNRSASSKLKLSAWTVKSLMILFHFYSHSLHLLLESMITIAQFFWVLSNIGLVLCVCVCLFFLFDDIKLHVLCENCSRNWKKQSHSNSTVTNFFFAVSLLQIWYWISSFFFVRLRCDVALVDENFRRKNAKNTIQIVN